MNNDFPILLYWVEASEPDFGHLSRKAAEERQQYIEYILGIPATVVTVFLLETNPLSE